MDTNSGTPTLTPPAASVGSGGTAAATGSRPTIADAATAGVVQSAPQAPSAQPPGGSATRASAGTAGANGITGAWHNGVTVDALWAINETRNAFMRVVGVGWKKIYNGTDGAFTALTTLASQARQTGATINYRDEADGLVHEIYLW